MREEFSIIRRRRLGGCLVVVICAGIPLVSAQSAPEDLPDGRPWTHAVEAPPYLFATPTSLDVPELLGYTIAQNGSSIADPIIELEPGRATTFTLYWRRTSALARMYRGRILIRAAGNVPSPAYTYEFELNMTETTAGVTITQELAIPLPQRRFVGAGVLSVAISPDRNPDWNSAPTVCRSPIIIIPIVWSAQYAEIASRYADLPDATDLKQSTRLAPGCEVEIPIPTLHDYALVGLELYSCLHLGDAVAAGTPVLKIQTIGADGGVLQEGEALMGRDTDLSDSTPSSYIGVGRARARSDGTPPYLHCGQIRFTTAAAANRVRIVYVASEGVMDIYAIVAMTQPSRHRGSVTMGDSATPALPLRSHNHQDGWALLHSLWIYSRRTRAAAQSHRKRLRNSPGHYRGDLYRHDVNTIESGRVTRSHYPARQLHGLSV